MRDMHCHILPGVDDGAADLQESLAMVRAARDAGVTSIVCTPHVRDPYFDYEAMCAAYELLKSSVDDMPLALGWEVNHHKLMELGMDWCDKLHFEGSDEFLLELSSSADRSRFDDYTRTIFELQGRGYEVVIAHPERYAAIQKDPSIAQELVRKGCKLQASCDFIAGGRLGREKKPAKALMKAGLYTYIASDAHHSGHYRLLAKAQKRYGRYLRDPF